MHFNLLQFLWKKKRLATMYANVTRQVAFLLWLNASCLLSKRKVVIIALYEHIGDIIACEPIIRQVKENHPNDFIVFACNAQYVELQQINADIDKLLGLHFFSEWILLRSFLQKFLRSVKVYDLHLNNKKCSKFKNKLVRTDCDLTTDNMYNNNRNLVDIFSIAAGLPISNTTPVFHLDCEKAVSIATSPYIVFHTQTNALFKDWHPDLWSKLCDELSAAGFEIVEIGLNRQVKSNSSIYIDFTGKQSLQVVANLIADCTLFVGLDSGFAHMANALQVNGLILMGQFIQAGKVVSDKYNPFPGLYNDDKFIIRAEHGATANLAYDVVYSRVMDALSFSKKSEAHSSSFFFQHD